MVKTKLIIASEKIKWGNLTCKVLKLGLIKFLTLGCTTKFILNVYIGNICIEYKSICSFIFCKYELCWQCAKFLMLWLGSQRKNYHTFLRPAENYLVTTL